MLGIATEIATCIHRHEGKPLMVQLAQDRRIAQLQTPLGKDVLVLASFVATEGLSDLFEINVEALSAGDMRQKITALCNNVAVKTTLRTWRAIGHC
jgi:uncharacterized protein involved in type VI secretion and phage assembly